MSDDLKELDVGYLRSIQTRAVDISAALGRVPLEASWKQQQKALSVITTQIQSLFEDLYDQSSTNKDLSEQVSAVHVVLRST